MSRNAERWLAEHEIAMLEAIYELESPPGPEDWREPFPPRAQNLRRPNSPSNPPQSNGAITG
jgi:hypothetical protein